MSKKTAIKVLCTSESRSEAWKEAVRLGPVARKYGKEYSVGVVRRKGTYQVELYKEEV